MKRLLASLLTLVVGISIWASVGNNYAIDADSAYNVGDYSTALRLYKQAIEKEGPSAQLYYNLGNSYYRVGRVGQSVVCYKRALNIDPSMREAQDNLSFIGTQIIDRPEDDSSFLTNLHGKIVALMKPNAWAWVAFAFFALTLGCIAMYFFYNSVAMRKLGFFGAFAFAALCIYAVIVAAQSSSAYRNHAYAVVIVPTSNFSTTPGNVGEGSKIIPIHEGTIVEVIDSMAVPGQTSSPMWYNVKINNSTKAWARSVDLERI